MAFSSNAPFPFGGQRDITANSSPLTHHDNLSVLRMLEWLRKRCEDLEGAYSSSLEKLDEDLRKLIADVDRADDEDRGRLEGDLNDKIGQLRHAVDILSSRDLTDVFAFDPTNGRRDETISEALGHVYDEDRVFAYRASDEDSLGLTAAQTDELGREAMQHDLWATEGVLNVLPGDLEKGSKLATVSDIVPVSEALKDIQQRLEALEEKVNK